MSTNKQYTVVTNFVSKGAGELVGFIKYLQQLDTKGLKIDFSPLTQQLGSINELFNNITSKKVEKAEANQQVKSLYKNLIKSVSLIDDPLKEQQNASEKIEQRKQELQKRLETLNASLEIINNKVKDISTEDFKTYKEVKASTKNGKTTYSNKNGKTLLEKLTSNKDLRLVLQEMDNSTSRLPKLGKYINSYQGLSSWLAKAEKAMNSTKLRDREYEFYNKAKEWKTNYDTYYRGYTVNKNGQSILQKDYGKSLRLADTVSQQEKTKNSIDETEKEIDELNETQTELNENSTILNNIAALLKPVESYLALQLNGVPVTKEILSSGVPQNDKDKFNDTLSKEKDVLDILRENNEAEAAEIDKRAKDVEQLANQYLSFGTALLILRKAAIEAYNTIKQLDSAFNEIAVVSEYSTKQVWDMYDSFLAIANATGTTSKEIIQVAGEYFKQGKSLQESLTLTEAAAMAATVAGIDAAESVKYLTAALNGYNLSANSALDVSDKFSKLAAISATDYADLATAMTKVAAQANAAGVEMDSLLGFMTTALEVTQEAPENIGTAFKTIFARMSEIKDYGATIEDNVSANQVSKALDTIGISLFDVNGEMRDLDDVLFDVGEQWSSLNSVQQKYITTALAGTRQQTRLVSIFQDWDKTLSYVEAAQNSEGATLAQQIKYTESLEYSLSLLNNAWENFTKKLSASTVIKTIVESIAGLINDLAGGKAWTLLIGLTGFLTSSQLDKIFDKIGKGIWAINKALTNSKNNILSIKELFTKMLSESSIEGNNTILKILRKIINPPMSDINNLIDNITKKSDSPTKFFDTSLDAALGTFEVGIGEEILNIGNTKQLTEYQLAYLNALSKTKVQAGETYFVIDKSLGTITQKIAEAEAQGVRYTNTFEDLSNIVIKTLKNPFTWVTVAVSAYKMITAAIEKAKKKAEELYASIYNRKETVNSIEDLIEQYNELSKILNKTNEQYEEMDSLISNIKEKSNNEIIFSSSGLDYNSYQDWINNQKEENKKESKELLKELKKSSTFMGGIDRYYNDDEISTTNLQNIEQIYKMELATLISTGELVEDQYAAIDYYWDHYDSMTKDISDKISNAQLFYNKLHEISAPNGSTALETLSYGLSANEKRIIKNYERYGASSGITQEAYEKIKSKQGISNSDLAKLIKDEDLSVLENSSIWSLKYGESDDYDNVFNALQYLNSEASMTVTIMKNTEQAWNEALDFIQGLNLSNLNDELTSLVNSYAAGVEDSDLDQYYQKVSDIWSNFQEQNDAGNVNLSGIQAYADELLGLGVSSEEVLNLLLKMEEEVFDYDWSSTINNGKAAVTSIENINSAIEDADVSDYITDLISLFTDYPEYIDEIANSIKNEGEISEDVTKQIIANTKEKAMEQLKTSADLDLVNAEYWKNEALRIADDAIYEQEYNQLTEDNYKDTLNNKLLATQQYYTGRANILNQYQAYEKKVEEEGADSAVLEFSYAMVEKLKNSTIEADSIREKAYSYAYSQAESYYKSYRAKITAYNAINEGYISMFGEATKETDDASDSTEEYTRQLTELYTILQKIESLDAFKDLIAAAREYYDEVDDGASQRAIDNKTIDILEQEISLYKRKSELLVKQQNKLAGTLSKEAAQIISIDEATGRLILDYDKYANVSDELAEEIDDFAESWEDLQEDWEDAQKTYWDLMQEIEELNNQVRDQTIEYQNQLKEAFVEYYQDLYQMQIDALDKEKDLLDKRKELYDDVFNEQDYSDELQDIDKQRQQTIAKITALEGASDSTSKQKKIELMQTLEDLNKEYNEKVVNYNRDALDQQIEDQSNMLDEQSENLQTLMDDIPNQVEMLEQAVKEITAKGVEAVNEFLSRWSDDWQTALSTERQKIEDEWTELYDYLYGDAAISAYTKYYDGLLAKAKQTYAAIQAANGSGNGTSSDNSTDTNNSSAYSNYDLNESWWYGQTKVANKDNFEKMITSQYGFTPTLTNSRQEYPISIWKDNNGNYIELGHPQARMYGYNTLVKRYAKGGYVKNTGLAWVDGSPSAPEAFLSSYQTSLFENLTSTLEKLYNNNGYSSGLAGLNIENIIIKTDSLNNEQDFAKAGNALASSLQNALWKRGITTNLKQ